MALIFYNTLSRKKDLFFPFDKGKVRMYTCGPTVYDYAHIGNLRAYIFADILKRVLLYSGLKVKHIMNLTDIDDKTIRDSQKEGKTLEEFTEFYSKEFFKDIKSVNMLEPTKFTKATDYIDDMVLIIEKLLEKGLAYKSEDGSIYFDIKKFKDYGKLSRLVLENQRENASGRIASDEYDKENVQDFALWKAWNKKVDGNIFWETGLGKGRPGWHIECSAMSMKTLGEQIDIHTGGVDNIFPHHENEIAQSEGVTGKQIVNYRTRANFVWEALEGAETALKRLYGLYAALGKEIGKISAEYKLKFKEYLEDDLDTPRALTVLWDVLKDENLSTADKKATVLDFEKVLGLGFADLKEEEIPEEIQKL